jgi:hypothetical protein
MAINVVCDSSIIIMCQGEPYVFNVFVFHSLLDQTFFETHGMFLLIFTKILL